MSQYILDVYVDNLLWRGAGTWPDKACIAVQFLDYPLVYLHGPPEHDGARLRTFSRGKSCELNENISDLLHFVLQVSELLLLPGHRSSRSPSQLWSHHLHVGPP